MAVDFLTAGQRYDVAILGGGVAGLSCAIESAQLGLSAIVIDRPNARLHPGECLHPGVELILQRLGLANAIAHHGVPRPLGMWHTKGGSGLQFVPYGEDQHGPWRGYQLRRSLLTRLLARRAGALGVDAFTFKGKSELILSRGRVSGLLLDGRQVCAGYVIDAAGGAHWIARRLGIGINQLSPPLHVRWGYVSNDRTAWDHAPWLDMHRNGWVWRARVGTAVHAWVQLGDQFTHTQPPHMGASAKSLCRPRAADSSWRILDRCSGPGWIAVGDAAAVLDPISGDGVLRAFTTGIAAAAAAAAALRGDSGATPDMLGYDGLLRNGVTRRAEQLRQYVPWIAGAEQ